MNAYPVLQSGFVGLSQQGLRRPDIIEPTLRQAVIFKEYKLPLTKYFYSAEVTELYTRWCGNAGALKDFDFRERIIQAAFSSFGHQSFYVWLRHQAEKPTVSDLHKAFLVETLQYLLNGSPRGIENVQWIRLLEATQQTHSVRVDVDKYFGTETMGVLATQRVPVALSSVIKAWISMERGFEDLLITLFVIFGDRSDRIDISNAMS